MAGDQGREGRLVARVGVAGQELRIAEPDGRAVAEQITEVPQGPPHRQAARHRRRSPRIGPASRPEMEALSKRAI